MNSLQRDLYGYLFAVGGGVLLLVWCIPTYSPEYPGYGVPATLVPNVAAGFWLLLALLGLGRTVLLWRRNRPQAAASGAPVEGASSSGPSTSDVAAADAPVSGAPVSGASAPQIRIFWGHLARFFLPCALFMPAIQLVGFIPAGMVFLLLMQWFCGQRKPVTLAVVAVLPVLILYALMRFALGIPLP